MTENVAFIVGAQRAGTTYLSQLLDQHPQITMAKPLIPEPKFFMNGNSENKVEYFSKFYEPTEATKLFIEKSASYIETPEAGRRIKKMFPDARLIITFRNPVFRAISNYFYSVRNGLENRSIEAALLGEEPAPSQKYSTSVSPFNYLERGYYARYLKTYFDIFDKSACRVILFTRFVGREDQIRSLFQWLEVDETFNPTDVSKKVNSNDVVYDVDPQLVSALRLHFQPFNQELEELLNMEIPEWRLDS